MSAVLDMAAFVICITSMSARAAACSSHLTESRFYITRVSNVLFTVHNIKSSWQPCKRSHKNKSRISDGAKKTFILDKTLSDISIDMLIAEIEDKDVL